MTVYTSFPLNTFRSSSDEGVRASVKTARMIDAVPDPQTKAALNELRRYVDTVLVTAAHVGKHVPALGVNIHYVQDLQRTLKLDQRA